MNVLYLRALIAAAAMESLLQKMPVPQVADPKTVDTVTKAAVKYAEALIRELETTI